MTVLRRAVRWAVGAVAGAALLSACSGSPATLDQTATQRAVGRAVAAEVDPVVSATQCDEDVEQERDGMFSCTVALKGVGDLPVDVRQTDDEGTLEVAPAAAVVTNARITEELTAALKKRFGRTFTVRCSGDAVEVRRPASTSTCSAEDATSRREVTVTVTDASGTLAFAVAPPK